MTIPWMETSHDGAAFQCEYYEAEKSGNSMKQNEEDSIDISLEGIGSTNNLMKM
jgi:hypothetical protein